MSLYNPTGSRHLNSPVSTQSEIPGALVLAPNAFQTSNAKTAHGLVRDSRRFNVQGIVDAGCAGKEAGTLLDGESRHIPIFSDVTEAYSKLNPKPTYCIVGVATHGGRLPENIRVALREAASLSMNLVSGLHEFLVEDPVLVEAARNNRIKLIDIRKPKSSSNLHFWTGEVRNVKAPRIAVLGMDCAVGKRTTTVWLVEACRDAGIEAEMIYTGQTGWLQGAAHGIVLDSLPNDFVSGELEHAILECDRAKHPDLMILEGQSALRNPSGPCGAELLLSGGTKGVILQHAPGRGFFDGHEEQGFAIPKIGEEIALIKYYGARTLAITLNTQGLSSLESENIKKVLQKELGIPVIRPLEEGVASLLPVIREYLNENQKR